MSRTSFGADASGRTCLLEPLEGRCLFSSVGIAVVPPPVRMLGRPLVTGGTEYAFSLVVFSSRPAYTSGSMFEVRGPNGYVAPVEVTRARVGQSHSLLACRVDAPGVEFDRSDNGLYTVGWRSDPRAVTTLTTSSTPFGRFRVFSSVAPEAPPALPLSDRATAGALSVTLDRVYAWCDHMPIVPPDARRQYLILSTTLKNNSDRPLEVTLSRSYISFDENDVGQETHGISIKSASGPPSGVKTLVLQPGEERVVQFRGDGVYPEDRHGQRLYVTLEFTAGGATAAVRNSGVVMVSH